VGFQADAITLGVALPVGISFYTFQTLGYTIDVYRRRFEPEPQLLDFALFVAFFPQLVAGPIERAAKLLPQLKGRRRVTADRIASGLWLIAWGYFLKVFAADNLGPIVDTVFAGDDPSALATLTAVYAFAFQIFGDFAGYSSIAIGLAQLFGIELSTNFLFPYFATNPREFWRSWHITLSTWLRDYLYVPLGGNRDSCFRTYRNLFVTMLLGGLWHGANWTFVAWGAFHGALLCVHRMLPKSRRAGGELMTRPFAGLWTAFRILVMFQLVCLGWLVFRSASLDQAVTMYSALAGAWRVPLQGEITWALEVAFYGLPVLAVSALQRRTGDVRNLGAIPRLLRIPLLVAMFYGLVCFGNWGGGDFYYFQF
jgi:alginate O-acetyltransferase complex protein AlgI